jgi:hypothetical protein
MESPPHAVDVCEWQGARVSAIGEQDKDSLVSWIIPAARSGKTGMSKSVRRKVRTGRGVFCFGQLPTE